MPSKPCLLFLVPLMLAFAVIKGESKSDSSESQIQDLRESNKDSLEREEESLSKEAKEFKASENSEIDFSGLIQGRGANGGHGVPLNFNRKPKERKDQPGRGYSENPRNFDDIGVNAVYGDYPIIHKDTGSTYAGFNKDKDSRNGMKRGSGGFYGPSSKGLPVGFGKVVGYRTFQSGGRRRFHPIGLKKKAVFCPHHKFHVVNSEGYDQNRNVQVFKDYNNNDNGFGGFF